MMPRQRDPRSSPPCAYSTTSRMRSRIGPGVSNSRAYHVWATSGCAVWSSTIAAAVAVHTRVEIPGREPRVGEPEVEAVVRLVVVEEVRHGRVQERRRRPHLRHLGASIHPVCACIRIPDAADGLEVEDVEEQIQRVRVVRATWEHAAVGDPHGRVATLRSPGDELLEPLVAQDEGVLVQKDPSVRGRSRWRGGEQAVRSSGQSRR